MRRPTESDADYLARLKRQLDHAENQAVKYPGRITGTAATNARRELAGFVKALAPDVCEACGGDVVPGALHCWQHLDRDDIGQLDADPREDGDWAYDMRRDAVG